MREPERDRTGTKSAKVEPKATVGPDNERDPIGVSLTAAGVAIDVAASVIGRLAGIGLTNRAGFTAAVGHFRRRASPNVPGRHRGNPSAHPYQTAGQ